MTIILTSIREPMPAGARRAALQANGTVLVYMPGDTLPVDPPTPLADVKLSKAAAINEECRARIFARYGPPEEQVSRLAGVYGSTERDAMTTGIAATIDASNVAQNTVIAATTAAQVEAVTATWPAI